MKLTAIGGEPRTIEEWLTTFQLLTVVLDPYTHESAWILETARRFLANFSGADCRVAWTVTADEADAKRFLGPLAEEFLTFTDPDRELAKALELDQLPALVYIRQDLAVVGQAEGWSPPEWEHIGALVGKVNSWSYPSSPAPATPARSPAPPPRADQQHPAVPLRTTPPSGERQGIERPVELLRGQLARRRHQIADRRAGLLALLDELRPSARSRGTG